MSEKESGKKRMPLGMWAVIALFLVWGAGGLIGSVQSYAMDSASGQYPYANVLLATLTVILLAALELGSGILLYARHPFALPLAEGTLLGSVVICLLNLAEMAYFASNHPAAQMQGVLQGFAFQLILQAAVSVLLLWYLLRARSVRDAFAAGDRGIHRLWPLHGSYEIWPLVAVILTAIFAEFGFAFAVVALGRMYRNRKLKGRYLALLALLVSFAVIALSELSYFGVIAVPA